MKFLDRLFRRSPDPDAADLPVADQMAADAGLEQAHQLHNSVNRRQPQVDWLTGKLQDHQEANHFAEMFGETMRRPRPHGSS